MNKRNLADIEAAAARAFASQVQRTLETMRIAGWRFPPGCDVGIKLIAATPATTKYRVRIDDVSDVFTVRDTRTVPDIDNAVDDLVARWLKLYAFVKPRARGAAHRG